MDALSRRNTKDFDRKIQHFKMVLQTAKSTSKGWLRSLAVANNGVLDLTKFNLRGGVRGQKKQEHNYTTEQPYYLNELTAELKRLEKIEQTNDVLDNIKYLLELISRLR